MEVCFQILRVLEIALPMPLSSETDIGIFSNKFALNRLMNNN